MTKAKKSSVEDVVKRFCGFPQLRKWLDRAHNDDTYGLILVLFKTGARISEVLGTERTEPFKRNMFEFEEDWYRGIKLPVLKKYDKVGTDFSKNKKEYKCKICGKKQENAEKGEHCPAKEGEKHSWEAFFPHWKTKPKDASRTIRWPADEPLNEEFKEFVQSFEPHEPMFDISRITAWFYLNEVDDDLFPHRLRAERATMLAEKYNFTTFLQKKFFKWETDDLPDIYTGEEKLMKDFMEAKAWE